MITNTKIPLSGNAAAVLRRVVWSVAVSVCLVAGMTPARSQSAPVNISVGTGPVLSVAALQMAMANGYFKDEGLNVTGVSVQSGAATLAGVIGGSLQFAATNVTSVAIARAHGLKIRIIAQEAAGSDNQADAFDAVLVKEDAPYKTAADLAGRTIAVNAINSIATLTTNRSIEKAGGDYSAVKYVELPQGDSLNAIATGNIAAAWIVEPFITLGKQRGMRVLFSPYHETDPHFFAESVLVASEDYINANPGTVQRFQLAMTRALKLAAADPEAVRKILPTYMKLDPALIAQINLPSFPTEINVPGIKAELDLVAHYKYIDTPVTTDDLIWPAK